MIVINESSVSVEGDALTILAEITSFYELIRNNDIDLNKLLDAQASNDTSDEVTEIVVKLLHLFSSNDKPKNLIQEFLKDSHE